MSQGPRLTYHIKKLIAEIRNKYHYGPTETRKELLIRMKNYGLDRDFGPDWPGVSAVGKVLLDLRKKEGELGPDPEDELWSMLSLGEHDIPPEVLPFVFEAWGKALLDDKPLTIREVKWITRLYYLLKDKDMNFVEDARTWAEEEKSNSLIKGHHLELQDMWFFWIRDANLYSMIMDDKRILEKVIDSLNWPRETWLKLATFILEHVKGDKNERLPSKEG